MRKLLLTIAVVLIAAFATTPTIALIICPDPKVCYSNCNRNAEFCYWSCLARNDMEDCAICEGKLELCYFSCDNPTYCVPSI